MIFAVFAMLIRVPVYLLSLIGSNVDRRGRLLSPGLDQADSVLCCWSCCRCLRAAGQRQTFRVCALIVLISVVIHGASPMLLLALVEKNSSLKNRRRPSCARAGTAIASGYRIG